jgi:hypothetical protein
MARISHVDGRDRRLDPGSGAGGTGFPPRVAGRSGGVGVVVLPDPRRARCDIKSVGLLSNVLARRHTAAARRGSSTTRAR